ncbi:MAG: sn-glycerol-3-phosphate ABC transporter ATP-binding protein UgpC [Pseudomonadota bacterium]
MAALDLIDLHKSYGPESLAVDHLSLAVADKEFIVIVGPSGCGKSTTLRLVAGIEEETSGQIHIGGRSVTSLSPGARNVAMVFQDYALYPHMSVERNIGFGLRRRGMAQRDVAARVREIAEILEIGPLLSRRPAALSGGQRQRVAMGRAMVRKPDVFLFDEPLSNLDARLRVSMRSEMRRLQAQMPTTTLYVTHDQTEAMTMADRVVVMNNGRVEQVGPPMEIYRAPANLFVARFIGSPAMNLFDARIGDGFAALSEGTRVPISSELAQVEAGRRVTMGFRPEAISLSSEGIPARVLSVEPLGQEIIIECETALGTVRSRLAPDTELSRGDTITLAFDARRAHLFDPETGRALPFPCDTLSSPLRF